jgi:hypothetical protein
VGVEMKNILLKTSIITFLLLICLIPVSSTMYSGADGYCEANGNDADLGEKIRNLFRTDSFVTSMPNDYVLGEEIRKAINNI